MRPTKGGEALKVVVASFVVALLFPVLAETSSHRATIAITAIPTRQTLPRPPGGRAGDVELLRWGLRDRFGRPIGVGLMECRWHRRLQRLCVGEIRLPLGTIAISGQSQTRSLGTWAVTGGTGRYLAAGGELRYVATDVDRLTITIVI